MTVVDSINDAFKTLSQSKNTADFYLTSAFSMFSEEAKQKDWFVTFFNKKSKTLETVSSKGTEPATEAFTKDGKIEELNLNHVKILDMKALSATKLILKASSKGELIDKTVMVLQTQNKIPIWNITYISAAFNVINIKISAETAKKISHNLTTIQDFMQGTI